MTKAVALSNCCVVKSLNVYLINTCVPGSEISFGLNDDLNNKKEIIHRYASVLPPPVGNHRRSATFLLGLFSSINDSKTKSINASWKGLHENISLPAFQPLCSAIAKFAN